MRERVQQRVDAECIAGAGKLIEVGAVLSFTLEGITVVGVVRDEDEDAAVAFRVQNRPGMRDLAVMALRRSAGLRVGEPEAFDGSSFTIPVGERRSTIQRDDVVPCLPSSSTAALNPDASFSAGPVPQ